MNTRLFIVFTCAVAWAGANKIATDVAITDAQRDIDISTQLATVTTTLNVELGSPQKFIIHAVDAQDAAQTSFVEAKVDGKTAKIALVKVDGAPTEHAYYKIEASMSGKAKVVITEVITHKLEPHPSQIAQADTQLVLYTGNAYVLSPYTIKRCKTSMKLSGNKVESVTKVSPSEHSGDKVTYGAYDDVKPYTVKVIRVHYENYTPFIVVTRLERTIEISHWGNAAVEEFIEIEHVGAKLKGPFSRYDYQRDQRQDRQPSVATFKTILPASARDVYYRDEIGNISTSHMKVRSDAVEVNIRPRFPLFGGWKTNYMIGYNVPSYEYLYSKGSNFALKMRFFDHIYDNIVVDEMTLKVILPERSENIKLSTPFPVTQDKNGNMKTYLDYVGRPVVIAHKKNLCEKHIQNFELHYTFDRSSMIHEPLMLIAAFATLFAALIIYVRLDFTISSSTAVETRGRAVSKN